MVNSGLRVLAVRKRELEPPAVARKPLQFSSSKRQNRREAVTQSHGPFPPGRQATEGWAVFEPCARLSHHLFVDGMKQEREHNARLDQEVCRFFEKAAAHESGFSSGNFIVGLMVAKKVLPLKNGGC